MTIVLTVTVEIGGDQAQDASAKITELLPERNGLVASGMAGVLVRRLCRCGLVARWPQGWHIDSLEVRCE